MPKDIHYPPHTNTVRFQPRGISIALFLILPKYLFRASSDFNLYSIISASISFLLNITHESFFHIHFHAVHGPVFFKAVKIFFCSFLAAIFP